MFTALQALTKFGVCDDVKDLVKVADKDGDGQIDYSEFVLLMRETNKELKQNQGDGASLRGRLGGF